MSQPIESRADFQQLAAGRLAEAKALLDLGKWDGAYYLAGYNVELALKACIIKRLMATDAFPDKDYSRDCYTHSVEKLVGLADLKAARKTAADADLDLNANWALAAQWSEGKRYWRIDQKEAEALYAAIADSAHGVFAWIKTQW